MKSTLQHSTPDFSNLIGVPYEVLDCWGIVREYYSRLGYALKPYYEAVPNDSRLANKIIYSNMGEFERVKDGPKTNDILLIRLMGIECHIAVYLGEGRILHTQKKTGCIVDRYAKWGRAVTGIFRVRND